MEKTEIAELERQRNEAPEGSLTKAVGDMLRGMVAGGGIAAEVVAQDLENKEMSLKKCADKLTAYAREHQKAGCYWMPPEEAGRIIREFYGIPEEEAQKPEREPQTEKREKRAPLDLPDLFDLI